MPEQGIRDQFIEIAKSFPNKEDAHPTNYSNLHVTLLFLGDVEESAYKCLEKKVVQTFVQPFTIRLDMYGYFRRSKTVWIGCSSYPNELTRLINRLKSIGVQCGLDIDDKPYKPHVTLFSKAHKADFPSVPFSINWKVSEFHLIESIIGEYPSRYKRIATYRLMEE